MAVGIVLDTNVILYHFAGRLADRLLQQQYLISVITEMELLSYPMLTAFEEQRTKVFLERITRIELTDDVREAAIRLRRTHRLKLPDAIIAGTAQALDAELWTNDLRLTRIPDLRCQLVELKGA